MDRFRTICRRVVCEESGVSLTELLVAMTVGVMVLFAALQFNDTAIRSQAATSARTDALQQAQVGLERMTRELRQATSVTLNSSQDVDVETYVRTPSEGDGASLRSVSYVCDAASDACRRFVDGSVTGETIVTDVQNADVFNAQPPVDPAYVGVTLKVRVAGYSQPITLHDGVELRNRVQ